MEEKKVIIYTQSTCSPCQEAKDWLVELGLPFEVRDIRENQQFLDELHQLGSMNTPTFVVGEETIIGLNKGKVKKAWTMYV